VWARRIGTTAAYESWTSSGVFDIAPSRLSVTSLEADRVMPVMSGTAITWNARTRGGTAGPLQFKFVKYSAQTASWRVVQDYSTSRTYSWRPTWGDEGFHVLQVWVKSSGSAAGYDAWLATEPFEVRRAPLQLTTDSVFPVPPTANVLWTAEVPDPSLSLEYSFYVYDRSKGTWSVGRQYNPSNTFNWTPGASSTYALQVWARRPGSSAAYDAWRGTDYLDVFSSPAKLKSVTVDAAFPSPTGTPITWTATASGGTAALEYRFVIYNASTGWRVLQEYSPSRSTTWTPRAQDAGTYAVQVWVRSTGSASSFEDWQATSYFVIRP
jgi:N-acetylmuramoyl-L-alanine amidase